MAREAEGLGGSHWRGMMTVLTEESGSAVQVNGNYRLRRGVGREKRVRHAAGQTSSEEMIGEGGRRGNVDQHVDSVALPLLESVRY